MEEVKFARPDYEAIWRQKHHKVVEMRDMVELDYVQALREAAKTNGYVKVNGRSYAVVDIHAAEGTAMIVDMDCMSADRKYMMISGWYDPEFQGH